VSARETVELVTGEVFFSDDHWRTIWKLSLGGSGLSRPVTGKAADRIRYVALVQHGGGRDDVDGSGEGARPLGRKTKKGGAGRWPSN
jgi:hypothetical protein